MNELHIPTVPLTGAHLIEASAGTGKTYTITYLYLRLLLERGLDVEEILVVTFTEAATAELKDRIRALLSEALRVVHRQSAGDEMLAEILERGESGEYIRRLERALGRFDEAAIFTIHGFCQRMLGEFAFESGALFDAELEGDETALLQEVVDDWCRRHFAGGMDPFVMRTLQENKVKPSELLAVVRHAGREAMVLPQTDEPDYAADLAAVKRGYAVLGEVWAREGEDVGEMLLTHGGLSQASYKREKLGGWLETLGGFMTDGDALAPLWKEAVKFTPEALEKGTKKNQVPPAHRFFELWREYLSLRERLGETLGEYAVWLQTRLVDHVRGEVPRRKQQRGTLSFDDLLYSMRDALANPVFVSTVRARFGAALIDEFQDTDPVQYKVFSTLFADGTLFLIGDPKQAIYAFRGADLFTYLNAARAVPAENRHTLGRNWRSTPELVEAVNAVFAAPSRAFFYDDIEFHPVQAGHDESGERPALTFWMVGPQGDKPLSSGKARTLIARAVAAEMTALLRGGERPRDMAVLVRTNEEARLVRRCLQERGIPAVLETDESVFASPEAAWLLTVLHAVARPHHAGRVRAALLTPAFGLELTHLARMEADEREMTRWLECFGAWHELWRSRGFIRMFRAVLDEQHVRERLLAMPGGERALTNVLHLFELLSRASLEVAPGPDELLKWFESHLAGEADEEQEIRLESDDDAVRIQTIHKSKGLQYPVVFCPFSWSGSASGGNGPLSFHDPAHDWRACFDLGSAAHAHNRELNREEQLAENLRLLYVAMTRACRRCYVAWGWIENKLNPTDTSALAYELHHRDPDDGESVFASLGRLGDLSWEDRLSEVRRLEQACAGIEVTGLPESDGEDYRRTSAGTVELSCRSLGRRLEGSRQVTSFSALASHGGGAHDRDALPESPPRVREDERERNIFSFPRGARPGTMLHKIFEDIDFAGPAQKRRDMVKKILGRHGYDENWLDAVDAMVERVLTVPLDDGGLHLGEVGLDQRLNELEFYYPLNRLTPETLAAVLPEETRPAHLDFAAVEGFMHGFVDLVFVAGDKYYVVDWKSNHLGDDVTDYDRPALEEAMADAGYHLQYHLYAVALHRLLRLRLPDYDFKTHFGGVFYVFLRGVDPSRPELGVYRARPSAEVVDALDKLLIPEECA